MNEAEPAEYCRRKGLYPEQLARWCRACETANDWDREANRRLKSEQKADRKRIRRLERELHRKEKALAEAAALMVLRKKSRGDLGGARGRMISAPDRRRAVELIEEARKSGARLEPACRELGITARTYQRWTRDG